MSDKERELRKEAWLAGYAEAVRNYAIWNNGEQFVGVQSRPLKQVLAGLETDSFVTDSLRDFLVPRRST